MKAAVLVEPLKMEIKDVPVPEPGPGEVRLRVMLAGLCGSDHTLYHGGFGVPLPVIPGHEAVGRIEKLGSGVSGLAVGQRVTIQPNLSCDVCPLCVAGNKNICPSKIRVGVDANGVLAEYVKVPANCVWLIPDGLEDEAAVFTEPLACCSACHEDNRAARGRSYLDLRCGRHRFAGTANGSAEWCRGDGLRPCGKSA